MKILNSCANMCRVLCKYIDTNKLINEIHTWRNRQHCTKRNSFEAKNRWWIKQTETAAKKGKIIFVPFIFCSIIVWMIVSF